jgi:hypothetical protein
MNSGQDEYLICNLQDGAATSKLSSNTDIFGKCLRDKPRFPSRFLTKFGVEIDGRSRQNDGSVQEVRVFGLQEQGECYGALAMCMIGCAGPPTPY